MAGKTVSTLEFQQACLSLIDEVGRTHEVVTITDQGKAIARLVPLEQENHASTPKRDVKLVIGGLKGSVLRYDDPFAPAAEASEWEAAR